MKPLETIPLGNEWYAIKMPSTVSWATHGQRDGWQSVSVDRIDIKHRCPGSAVVHPVQKNTHRRWGVRVRCKGCKAHMPDTVKIFLKLQKLHAKVME